MYEAVRRIFRNMLPETKSKLRARFKPSKFFEFLQMGSYKVKITTPKQIQLYQEMYKHTLPKCGECKIPNSCCDPFTCEMVKEYAEEQGEHFELIDGMFLQGKQCIIPPHLRPLCTLHVCSINSNGCDPDKKWTQKYFQLRGAIEKSHYVS